MLGCLIEQEVSAPGAVPLTLNSLRLACNQTTGRDPVVAYDDRTVEDTLLALKSRGLARFVPPSAEAPHHPLPPACRRPVAHGLGRAGGAGRAAGAAGAHPVRGASPGPAPAPARSRPPRSRRCSTAWRPARPGRSRPGSAAARATRRRGGSRCSPGRRPTAPASAPRRLAARRAAARPSGRADRVPAELASPSLRRRWWPASPTSSGGSPTRSTARAVPPPPTGAAGAPATAAPARRGRPRRPAARRAAPPTGATRPAVAAGGPPPSRADLRRAGHGARHRAPPGPHRGRARRPALSREDRAIAERAGPHPVVLTVTRWRGRPPRASEAASRVST